MAKRFTFKLDPVLKVRQRKEDEQRRVVASCHRDVQNCEAGIDATSSELSNSRVNAVAHRAQDSVDVHWEQRNIAWQQMLVARIIRAKDKLARLQSALHNAQLELADRSKDVKALEKLREKRLAEHQLQVDREEQRDTDEIAANIVTRRNRNVTLEYGADR